MCWLDMLYQPCISETEDMSEVNADLTFLPNANL